MNWPLLARKLRPAGRGWSRLGVALGGAGLLALGACAVGPDYHRPTVAAPAAYREATNSAASHSLAELPWWSVFKDPALQDLAHVALTNNFDLRIALARVDEARALEAQAKSQFLPDVSYEGVASRGRNMFLELPNLNGGQTMNGFVGGFQALWEIDLWGRVRRLNEAARANAAATRELERSIRVSLVSGVAGAYFELLELDEKLAIARRTEESYRHTFQLFDDQHANGLASKLELARAKVALHTVSATIPDLERQIALKENEINALLGRNPGPVPRTATLEQQELPVSIPVGLPSTLLERRPDIRVAEQQVRAANAQIGVAIGDFFPRLGLTTFYGGTSVDLDQLVSTGGNTWSLAAAAAGPVFTGGRLTGRYHQAKAAGEAAKLHYQQTALNAFGEVADALITRRKVEESCGQQAEAVAAGRDAVVVATDRYRAGKASYFEVLEAQQELYPAENNLAHLEASRRLAVVQLYKALGGGWVLGEAEGAAAPAK
jgi:multidrug efflux system outer membrane protein